MMLWWQEIIYRRYETHGLVDKQWAAQACLHEIAQGRWQVFAYEPERAVFIVGPSQAFPEVGEVHMWADGGNIVRAGHLFMREVWAHSKYIALFTAIMERRVERYAQYLGWTCQGVGDLGQRFWIIKRMAA